MQQPPEQPFEQAYLSSAQAAYYLGLSWNALFLMRKHGKGPRFYRLTSGRARYARGDLDAWLRSHPQGGEAPPEQMAAAGGVE